MCGIFGVIHRDPRTVAEHRAVERARDQLTHRGPDEAGLWVQPGAALAHRRLRVLDLTHGQQPMVSADQRHALVYNGEVYNFADLQDRYRQRGVTFHTRCDTEVVLHALTHDGPDAVDRFTGMFALGFWDQRDRRLLLVRDRLGKKPLYWFHDESQFVFASEPKAIYHWLGRRFTIDPVAVDQFFARGYILSPRTIFKEIRKLPAGCRLTWDAQRWTGAVEEWWDFSPIDVPSDPTAALDQLDELMTDAIRQRLVSDVPIGCLLSGGIDSTLITAITARLRREPVEAFTIGFSENRTLDESRYAQMVAERHGCRWHHREVDIGDFLGLIDELTTYHDEPFANIAMFCMRRLAQMARQDLVVVLSGQGGDELSAGYPGRYQWAAPDASQGGGTWLDDLLMYRRFSTIFPWKPGRDTVFTAGLIDVLRRGGSPVADLEPFLDRHPQLDRLNRALYLDVKTNLPDYLVCVEERLSMSASLEARNPLLDHRIVQYMLSLPASMKVRGTQFKWILLELAKRYGPVEAVERPKQGFTPPFHAWIQSHGSALAATFRETDHLLAPVLSAPWRQYLVQGQYDRGSTIAVLYSLMFAAWARRYSQTIGDWGLDSATGGVARAAHDERHKVLRAADPAATGRALVFTHLLKELASDLAVYLVGDDDGWYRWLVQRSGRQLAAAATGAGVVVVLGHSHAHLLLSGEIELPSGATVVLFCPFTAGDQASVQEVLNQLPRRVAVSTRRAAQIDAQHAVLLAAGKWRDARADDSQSAAEKAA